MNNSNFDAVFDAIVIGSGAAGLYAALCLDSSYRVAIITKDKIKTGASDWAQGGIAAAINPEDSPKFHLVDTLKAGAGLCDRDAVQFLVENASDAINSLVDMGVAFDRKGESLAMTLEAAHSRPRVLHAADTTGRAIVSTLREQVLARPNITVLSQAFALKLRLDENNTCTGVSILHEQAIKPIIAPLVILATGGGGQVFSQTTNPQVSTGDGVAIAHRSGAVLRDLEFVQFHPTALTVPGAPRFLISEAVRGEGTHLIDSKGRRFAFDYHPDGELAPRDVVSRAIFTHLQKTGDSEVYLDLRPIPEERIRYRFPNIIRRCQKYGVDLFKRPIPVTPAAHYWMGGIKVDRQSATSVAGLYAVGETASTGVHGANRLASNSLLECVVYAAELANLKITPLSTKAIATKQATLDPGWQAEISQIKQIRQQLPELVWQSAGICRTQATLHQGSEQVTAWLQQLESLSLARWLLKLDSVTTDSLTRVTLPSEDFAQGLKLYAETLNLAEVSHLILQSALFRQESRGGHYRLDYPQTSDRWMVHTLIEQDKISIGNSIN